jgi:hypothetical protein
MGKTVLTSNSVGSATTANTSNNFFQLSNGWLVRRATEATSQIPYRTAGTISKVLVKVTTNNNAGDITLRTRKNGANGNIAITIPAGQIGYFEDTVNVDTVAPGDKFCYQSTTGGATGSMTYTIMSCVFDATTNYVTKLNCDGQGLATASTTFFFPVSGQVSGTTTSEANVQHKVKKAGTLKNLCISANANTRSTNTVATVRINGADTGIVATVTATTGFFEDFANNAAVAVDDLIDIKVVTGTGSGTLTIDNISLEYETTTGYGFITAGALGSSADLVVNANTTNYVVLGGDTRTYATEAETKLKTRIPMTLSNLTIWVPANTVSAASTFKTRINGADGNQSISIPSNTPGYYHDTTNKDIVDEDDDIDYILVTGATGTSMTVRQMSVWIWPDQRVSKSVTLINNIVARVSKNVTLRNDILARVSKQTTLRNNILGRFSKALTLRNNIVGRLSKSVTLRNNILQRDSKTITLRNNILERRSKSATLRNNILGRLSKGITIRNNILQRASKQITLRNNILQRMSKSITLINNILEEALIRMSKSLTLINNIEQRMSKQVTIRNDILARQSKSITLRNDILNTVSKTFTLRNNILERMSKFIILRNNIRVFELTPINLISSIRNLKPWRTKLLPRQGRQSVQEEFARDEADMMDKSLRKRNNKNKWVSRLG